ncbi:MAG: ABC transporter substrate-binding protein [Betaproteobacteria bacterium]
MRWLRTAVLALSILVVFGFTGVVIAVFAEPELMPPGPYHPRAVYYALRGCRVHPWVRVDPVKSYTLKVWSTRWPLFRGGYGYDDLIDEAEAEFRALYPNVEVEYVLLRLDEIAQAIAEAVDNSTPPDVCVAPFDPSLVESGLVVPVDAFMDRSVADDAGAEAFEPRALQALTVDGRVWAWPSWISVQAWAGNAQLLREAGVDVKRVMTFGWSYEDVLAMARALAARQAGVEERHRAYALVLETTSTASLDTLMRAAGLGLALEADGSLAWHGAPLVEALSFLEEARDEGAFPEPVSRMGERMLELFWTGRAAVIGPVGPGFARHVRERLERIARGDLPSAREGVEPVLLPVPHPRGGEANSCTSVTSVMAFKRPGPGGEDAARLAVEFARLLARKEALWLAKEMCVVPAHLGDRQRVLGMIGPDGASERFLTLSAASGTACGHKSARLALMEKEVRARAIAPALAEFWKGALRARDFDAYVTRLLGGGAPAPGGAKRN